MKHHSRGLSFRSSIICAALLLSFLGQAQQTPRQNVHVPLPAAARTAQPVSRMAPIEQLTLAIGLPLRNQAALNELLHQIYDPSSPNYHHYISPEQFTEQFCPTEADYRKLEAFARANHLTVAAEHPNRLLLEVSGSVADIEQALHTTFHIYQHPTESRTFFAPDTEPSLDLALRVASIDGLDNYAVARPRLQVTPLLAGQNA